MIHQSIKTLVGQTPLYEPKKYARSLGVQLLTKLEFYNPAGSVKDRVALYMIEDAEKQGKLKEGGVIIEPTSGNTGIGLSAVATAKGYRVIIVMPDSMSVERRKLMKAYGAELVLTDGALGMQGAIDKARIIADSVEGGVIAGQFENPANVRAHYETTAPEIWSDTLGKVDVFVAGVGTGGTISGVGKFLKEKNPNVKIVAVEPFSSPLMSKGVSGKHGLQGIGANFLPKILDRSVIDEIVTVTEDEAFAECRAFAKSEGLLVGISSGAVLSAVVKLSAKSEYEGTRIVALLPDTGERYLSTDLF